MRFPIIAVVLLTAATTFAQPITSVADGDWNDPATWDCACVPDGIVSVTVAHMVTVTQPDSLLDGDLYIQSDGQLLGTSLVVGGIFFNFGQVTLQALEIKPGILQPDAVNFGTLAAIRLGLQREAFTNLGAITADSLRTDVAWENAPVGSVSAGWIAGQGQLDNRGSVTGSGEFAARFRNDSTITWSGLFRTPYTSSNLGSLAVVGELRIESLLLDSGLILVEGDVQLDGDLWMADDSAYLSIAGDLRINGLLRGAGAVCVTDSTVNTGMITDSVDVCDKSPTTTAPPFLDVDQGVVGPDVRWCTDPRCQPVGIDGPDALRTWSVWPVPSRDVLWTGPVPRAVRQVELIDATGRRIRIHATRSGDGLQLDLSALSPGPYLLRAVGEPGLPAARVLLAR
ncbi:MAG TPA: hypothetical protein PKE21_05565 [Flavobacteriales bacterium]|nr:hypothetical protein [Flavobacteriales bacterium]HMR26928.1 hypothetical protein [Flavobacteriales bacterium]